MLPGIVNTGIIHNLSGPLVLHLAFMLRSKPGPAHAVMLSGYMPLVNVAQLRLFVLELDQRTNNTARTITSHSN